MDVCTAHALDVCERAALTYSRALDGCLTAHACKVKQTDLRSLESAAEPTETDF